MNAPLQLVMENIFQKLDYVYKSDNHSLLDGPLNEKNILKE